MPNSWTLEVRVKRKENTRTRMWVDISMQWSKKRQIWWGIMIRTYKSQGSALGIAELLQGIETVRDGVESSRKERPLPSSLHKLTDYVLAVTLWAPNAPPEYEVTTTISQAQLVHSVRISPCWLEFRWCIRTMGVLSNDLNKWTYHTG